MDMGGWDQVAAWLEERLAVDGISVARIEREAGVNNRTVRALLDGHPVKRRDRLAVLAKYLGYQGDAFDRIREGKEPIPLPQKPDLESRVSSLERRFDRVEKLIEELGER